VGKPFILSALYDETCTCLAAESQKVKADNSQPGSFAQDRDSFVHGTLRLIKKIVEQARTDPLRDCGGVLHKPDGGHRGHRPSCCSFP
jgi:sugar (pentulose or hexulose) kinase